jgi:CO/xanthine dehydrogenase Mo-binding subunit
MPLIQEAVALRYGRPASEVSVAIQDLTGAGLVSRHFGTKSTAKAIEEFSKIGFTVNEVLGPKSS